MKKRSQRIRRALSQLHYGKLYKKVNGGLNRLDVWMQNNPDKRCRNCGAFSFNGVSKTNYECEDGQESGGWYQPARPNEACFDWRQSSEEHSD